MERYRSTRASIPYFFSRSDCPRDLNSFPTRRSSDLYFDALTNGGDLYWRLDAPWGEIVNWRQLTISPQDRKSTRLNSSHGYISYAVFCLKKKIVFRVLRRD